MEKVAKLLNGLPQDTFAAIKLSAEGIVKDVINKGNILSFLEYLKDNDLLYTLALCTIDNKRPEIHFHFAIKYLTKENTLIYGDAYGENVEIAIINAFIAFCNPNKVNANKWKMVTIDNNLSSDEILNTF